MLINFSMVKRRFSFCSTFQSETKKSNLAAIPERFVGLVHPLDDAGVLRTTVQRRIRVIRVLQVRHFNNFLEEK